MHVHKLAIFGEIGVQFSVSKWPGNIEQGSGICVC